MSIDLSLDRLKALLPHLPYTRPTLHIAGTNGKGSVSALLTSILAASHPPPLRIGRFNSPHLVSILDSITINDTNISRSIYQRVRASVAAADAKHGTKLTGFEMLTMTALRVFEEEDVDVVVLEVGMGGRLDATNIVPAECVLVSALTAVDLDHQAFLGDTVALIAREKAGIARTGRPFVLGRQKHGEVREVVDEVVSKAGGAVLGAVDVSVVDQSTERWSPFRENADAVPPPTTVEFHLRAFPSHTIRAQFPLHGAHQFDNLGTALGVIDALLTFDYPDKAKGNEKDSDTRLAHLRQRITQDTLAAGIAAVQWRGRLSFHRVSVPVPSPASPSSSPVDLLVLADGAHNPASAQTLADYISSLLPATSPAGEAAHITYLLSLSHSPPKTPLQTLTPILRTYSDTPGAAANVKVSVALLPFSPPEGMPWVKPASLDDMRDAVRLLLPDLDNDALWVSDSDAGAGADGALREALVWAAGRHAGKRERKGQGGLVVLAGSLYLVADFYRLLEGEFGKA